ncbi:hypothetical protein BDQ12DRAFT_138433 [Crucibulum laeve]|uniref:A-kinase anchor protein 7-like phosphoesterase domain-containing protein n=1 Tax=Crucibulum laeve TaxID=68775 RepID=A0A5C3M053_9AGAR|nr:hypothetical protein BDQ12DRAFT_138433 [Crucibulum laeve]
MIFPSTAFSKTQRFKRIHFHITVIFKHFSTMSSNNFNSLAQQGSRNPAPQSESRGIHGVNQGRGEEVDHGEWRGSGPRGRGGEWESKNGADSTTEVQRGQWERGRGRGGRGFRSGGRGNSGNEKERGRRSPRPTHFLSLPLHNHPVLRSKISAFQNALLQQDTPIPGLDRTLFQDPRRLHMTLGVMYLEEDTEIINPKASGSHSRVAASTSGTNSTASLTPASRGPGYEPALPTAHSSYYSSPPESKRTVQAVLSFLKSLGPKLSSMLDGRVGVDVTLDRLDALKTSTKEERVDAGVLYLAPMFKKVEKAERSGPTDSYKYGNDARSDFIKEEKERLLQVCEFIHQKFKEQGYIVDNRPLTLHCTILNTTNRRPHSRLPFSYTSILESNACQVIGGDRYSGGPPAGVPISLSHTNFSKSISASEKLIPSVTENVKLLEIDSVSHPPSNSRVQQRAPIQTPLPVDLGTYNVRNIELWVMGSHGPDNEYVSLGGIELR